MTFNHPCFLSSLLLPSTISDLCDQLYFSKMPTSTTRESDVDVLIIGAGPAGLMAANALARNGVKVRIIDQRSVSPTLLWYSALLISCFKDQLRSPQDKRMVFSQEQLRFSRLVY
jgi:NADPH-dependent glutamate synthase beta subunit-like oxidoreductase